MSGSPIKDIVRQMKLGHIPKGFKPAEFGRAVGEMLRNTEQGEAIVNFEYDNGYAKRKAMKARAGK